MLRQCGVDEELFAVGKTKMFLRKGVLDDLNRQRLTSASMRRYYSRWYAARLHVSC